MDAAQSRRAVLAGGLGAIGAWAAGAAAPALTRAGVDGDVVLGQPNASATTTKVTVATADFSAFWGEATGTGVTVGVRGDASSGTGYGVWGNHPGLGAGVFGSSALGAGVKGEGSTGVSGHSADGTGVAGYGGFMGMSCASTDGIGIEALSQSGKAVSAIASTGDGVVASTNSGTGVKATSGSGRAIDGRSESAFGVYGRSNSGTGVIGTGPLGVGVRGESSQGIGVQAVTTTGIALQTKGRLNLAGVSGVATIGANRTTVNVAPGVDITASSFVLLTPKANIGTRTVWFTTNATANTIQIRLSSARAAATPVAWLLLG